MLSKLFPHMHKHSVGL